MARKDLFVNAISCKVGGGINDLVHTLPLLASRLREHGWRTQTWVVEPGYRALLEAGYPAEQLTLVRASFPIGRAFWEFVRLPRLVRRRAPSVVFHFSNFIFRDLPFPQMTVLRSPTFFSPDFARIRRSGCLSTLHYLLGCRYSAKTVQWAASAFCISEAHRHDIIETLGDHAKKVRVSHLGLDVPAEARELDGLDRAAVLAGFSAEAREALQPLSDPQRQIILNVAHYYEHKNLGDLLEAFQILAEDRPGLTLILTAGLTTYNGPWSERTRQEVSLARKLAETGRLIDLGPVPRAWVWKLLALADVFAFPSSLESFGHPLLEAGSMGVPVVAADTPVHREVAGDAAVFHRVGDPQDVAAKIAGILDGTIARDELRANGLRRVAEFSWQRHADDLWDAIQKLSP
ncbi:MAG: glycosyltransferase [Pirellulales bacterium]